MVVSSRGQALLLTEIIVEKKGCLRSLFLSLVQWNKVPLWRAGVELAWTANSIGAADHLMPMSNPANRSCQGKDYGEHAGGNADGFQDNP